MAETHDPNIWDNQTGVLTKALLMFEMNRAIARARRTKTNAFVILIDIDDFTVAESRLGAFAAGQLLAALASRLQGRLRGTDLLGRYDGEQFVVVAEDHRDDTTDVVARKLLASISEPLDIDGRQVSITASIGVAEYPDHGETCADLLRVAEVAMLSVKAAGKNGVAVAEQEKPMIL